MLNAIAISVKKKNFFNIGYRLRFQFKEKKGCCQSELMNEMNA